jgi:hypothetical protein
VFADFAEEPADGFVDEVVGMVKEEVGDGEAVGKVAAADEVHGGDDGDALFPEAGGAGEAVEEGAVAVFEPDAEEFVAGEVHEVPVVDAGGMGKVEVHAFASGVLVAMGAGEALEEDEEGGEPCFVPGGGEEGVEDGEGSVGVASGDVALGGDGDAEEEVAFAVFAGTCLEKAGEVDGFFGGTRGSEFGEDGFGCHDGRGSG